MNPASTQIVIQRFTEIHIEGVNALYSDPEVCRQVLQMPYQSAEVWRKRLAASDERAVKLVALHEGEVIGNIGLEQYSRIRQRHVGSIGMGIAVQWQGRGVGSKLMAAVLEVADNWMNLHRVELTVFSDNEAALGLYRKFGFETEGRLRNYAVRDGVYVDAISMARLR
ncbi:GNAT family N-acetyltransferase [Pseudomonas sp. LP_7_YM]|uniref:GNAT family N-acetyltransferase n=1 Tax=Pseudomonas sp. LP_7_YM TaxID=2485137 RepID=UPI00105DF200|nr:GNAT family N-acetyltransferase [Pseudomonas sp. LP_7_YM]TDV63363.1 putative acetyltransferase [Pseudomonas sp. LP_7_YM]